MAESRFKPRVPTLNQHWKKADLQSTGLRTRSTCVGNTVLPCADAAGLRPVTRPSGAMEVGPQGRTMFTVRIKWDRGCWAAGTAPRALCASRWQCVWQHTLLATAGRRGAPSPTCVCSCWACALVAMAVCVECSLHPSEARPGAQGWEWVPTFSTAGGEKFWAHGRLTGTVFQELKRFTQASQEIYRLIGCPGPFLRPQQRRGVERWVKEPLSVPSPFRGWSGKCSSGLGRNGLMTSHHRNVPWPVSGRWSETWEKPHSSRWKVLCEMRMERLEKVGECWKVELKNSILLPACVALYHLGGWYSWPRDTPESDACLVFSFFLEPFSKERTPQT